MSAQYDYSKKELLLLIYIHNEYKNYDIFRKILYILIYINIKIETTSKYYKVTIFLICTKNIFYIMF